MIKSHVLSQLSYRRILFRFSILLFLFSFHCLPPIFSSTGGGIRNHTISSFWEKLLCRLGYACVPDARFGLAKPASWVPYVYQFHQSGLNTPREIRTLNVFSDTKSLVWRVYQFHHWGLVFPMRFELTRLLKATVFKTVAYYQFRHGNRYYM